MNNIKYNFTSAMQTQREETFGQVLKKVREEKGLSQEDLALATGSICTSGYISLLETEKSRNKSGKPIRPKEEKVDALAVALKVPVNYFRKLVGYAPKNEDIEASPDKDKLIAMWDHLSERSRRLLLVTATTLYEQDKHDSATPSDEARPATLVAALPLHKTRKK